MKQGAQAPAKLPGKVQEAALQLEEAADGRSDACKEAVAAAVESYERGKTSAAARTLREVTREQPKCGEAYLNLAILQRGKGQLKLAERDAQRALVVLPNSPKVLYVLATLLYKQAEKNVATLRLVQSLCSRALRLDPDFDPARQLMGSS